MFKNIKKKQNKNTSGFVYKMKKKSLNLII